MAGSRIGTAICKLIANNSREMALFKRYRVGKENPTVSAFEAARFKAHRLSAFDVFEIFTC